MIRLFAFGVRLAIMVALGAVAQGLSGAALAEGRHALVIGIDTYDQLTHLKKARNDARAMHRALRGAGFRTTLLEDTDQIGFLQAIADFSASIQQGDEAVVYFAGHGVEIDGQNYLLPSDTPAADPGAEIVLTSRSIPVEKLVDALHRRGARLSLLILDACRDNPFPRRGLRTIGGTRGLAQASPPEGTYILYSAGERETALDRLSDADPNPNSVFTRALLPLIPVPGLSLRDLSTQVRSEVRAMAASINHVQFPAVYDQLDGNFTFTKGDGVGPGQIDPCAAARADWLSVEQSGSEPALRAFIDAWPGCRVQKALAEEKLASLRAPSPAAPPAPPAARPAAAAALVPPWQPPAGEDLPRDCKLAAREWAAVTRSDLDAVKAFAARWVNCPTYGKFAEAIVLTANMPGTVTVAAQKPSAAPTPTAAPPRETTEAPRVCRLAEAELQSLDRDDPAKVKVFANRWAACTALVAEAEGGAACLGVSAAWSAVDLYAATSVQSFLTRYPDCSPLSFMAGARLRSLDSAANQPQDAAPSKPKSGSCYDTSRAWKAVDQTSRLSLESFLFLYPDCPPHTALAQDRLDALDAAATGAQAAAAEAGACVGVSAAWGAVDRDSLPSVQNFLTRYPDCAPQSATAKTRQAFLRTASRSGSAAAVTAEPEASASDYTIRQIAQIRLTLNDDSVLPSVIQQENLRSLDLAKMGLPARGGLRTYIKSAFGRDETNPRLTTAIADRILATPRRPADIAQNMLARTLFQSEQAGDWFSGMESGQCRVVGPAVTVSDPLVHMMPALIGSATPRVTGNAMNWLIGWPMPFVPARDVIAEVDGRRFAVDFSKDGSTIILPRTADGQYVDSALTQAMRRGTTLILTGINMETNEPVTFTFSLKGFTAAFDRMAKLCDRPQLRAWID